MSRRRPGPPPPPSACRRANCPAWYDVDDRAALHRLVRRPRCRDRVCRPRHRRLRRPAEPARTPGRSARDGAGPLHRPGRVRGVPRPAGRGGMAVPPAGLDRHDRLRRAIEAVRRPRMRRGRHLLRQCLAGPVRPGAAARNPAGARRRRRAAGAAAGGRRRSCPRTCSATCGTAGCRRRASTPTSICQPHPSWRSCATPRSTPAPIARRRRRRSTRPWHRSSSPPSARSGRR